MTKTEQEVLSSPFLDTVRDLRFDESEYSRIVSLLQTLAEEWAAAEVVNKRVAAELFILPSVMRGAAARLTGSKSSERLLDAAEEIETLALQCLMPE
jgi:hypothetical protein